jgi:hypothetical protein
VRSTRAIALLLIIAIFVTALVVIITLKCQRCRQLSQRRHVARRDRNLRAACSHNSAVTGTYRFQCNVGEMIDVRPNTERHINITTSNSHKHLHKHKKRLVSVISAFVK